MGDKAQTKSLLVYGCGFAFLWIWVFVFMFNPSSMVVERGGHTFAVLIRTSSMVGTIVAYMAMYVFSKKKGGILFGSKACSTAAIAQFASTGLIVLSLIIGTGDLGPMDLVPFVVGGACHAYFSLVWGMLILRFPSRSARLVVLLSFLAAIAAYAVFGMLGQLVCLTIASLLPIGQFLAFLFLSRLGIEVEHEGAKTDVSGDGSSPFFSRFMLVVFLSTFTFCQFREMLSVRSVVDATVASYVMIFMGAAVGIALLIAFFVGKEENGIGVLYRIGIPLVVLGTLAFSIVDRQYEVVAISLVMAGMRSASLLFWFVFIALASNRPDRAVFVYCFGQSISIVGAIFGVVIGSFMASALEGSGIGLDTISLATLFVMVLAVGRLAGTPSPFSQEKGVSNAPAFEEKIGKIASDCGLTKRETEIFGMLARGRTLTYVADKLYIAPSTVTTHAKHIYAKTGVKNRQELLDLFEGDDSDRL